MTHSLLNRALVFGLFVLLLFLLPLAVSRAAEPPALAGTIEAEIDGRPVALPSLKTDVSADIQGDLATVTVVQTFANPATQPLHARYLFPLNAGAAVYEMWMDVGAERVRAQIQEVQQAEKTFAKAKAEGRAAALLQQQRPNMFTQQIANLMPGLPITVTLRYVQTVPKVDGEYELVVPLVVGPRFQPPGAGEPQQGAAAGADALSEVPAPEPTPLRGALAEAGQWMLDALPDYPPVFGLQVPPQIDSDRVSLQVDLQSALPIQSVSSRTHRLATQADSATRWHVGLERGRTIDNRDFVLRYALAGAANAAGLLVQRDERGGYFSLLIEPPAAPEEADITPREMVFLLDCSGSMSGLPMEASKAFMRQALRKLRPTDRFRIIRFSDRATEFSRAPLTATAQNIASGLRYVDALQGMGGTMMSSGIHQALDAPPPAGVKRIVTFLTDGYIGNDYEILKLVGERLGDARLYTFGVGTGVNRFLMDEIGRIGRGFTRYMDPTEDVAGVAAELTDRLQSPVLTDIEIDWGGLPVEAVLPQRLPDLFAGQSIRVQGRYRDAAEGVIRIHGRARGRAATLILPVSLPEQRDGDAVGLIWARSAIAEQMRSLSVPPNWFEQRGEPVPKLDDVRQQVTQLGLAFSLTTRWTAFVAVSEQIVNATPEAAHTADVPLPPVAGVTPAAYGSTAPAFIGAAGPEPATWASLLIIMSLLAWLALARRRPLLA
jgi:Ca-activated chloride channel family protein